MSTNSNGTSFIAGRRLEGKVCIVTGASSGLGRGVAILYARQGAKVAIFDVTDKQRPGNFDESDGVTTADYITKNGGAAIFCRVDSTKREDTIQGLEDVVGKFGRVDIFFCGAGVYCDLLPLHEQPIEALDRCLNVQVRGSFIQSQEIIKLILKQGGQGTIVQLVSTAGLVGHPNQSVYDISKGAQAQLVRCIATEYGPNIRCNGICPTYIKSALTREMFNAVDTSEGKDWFSESLPLRRWGEISDVANLALYLASDESSYMTGNLIQIDGGEILSRYSK